MKHIKNKLLQFIISVALTFLIFCYASWGDFAWVTLTGPIALEPNLENMEGPSYIVSPALQAIITRLLFLVMCGFFCMIPDLAGGLRNHARYLLGLVAVVYVCFSYILGTLTFFTANAPGTTTLRIASMACIGILLGIFYDPEQKNFKIPGILTKQSFLVPLLCLFFVMCLVSSMIVQGSSWLFNEHLYFVLLRMGVFLTAFTGALAFHARKCGS